MIAGMSSSGLDLNGIAGLVAACGTAIGGVVVAVSGLIGKRNTTRREELRECEQERDDLEQQVLLLEMWAFQLCRALAQLGGTPIPRPVIAPKPTGGES